MFLTTWSIEVSSCGNLEVEQHYYHHLCLRAGSGYHLCLSTCVLEDILDEVSKDTVQAFF